MEDIKKVLREVANRLFDPAYLGYDEQKDLGLKLHKLWESLNQEEKGQKHGEQKT